MCRATPPLFDDHASDAPAVIAHELFEPDAVGDVGARRGGRVRQQRIEQGPPRRVERVHAVARFDADFDLVAAVVKRRGFDSRRPRRADRVEQTPARELQHARPHHREGRQRVRAARRLFDDQHVEACARQEHRGRRAGAPTADHHRGI